MTSELKQKQTTKPPTKKEQERRTYYADSKSAKQEMERWRIMYPWYGKLVDQVRDELHGRDCRDRSAAHAAHVVL